MQELAQTQDNPEEMVFEYFSECSFANQAVGRSILGSEDNILSFSRQQVVDFVHQYYIAPRIIISAAGNITHEELIALITEKFVPFVGEVVEEHDHAIYTGGHRFEQDSELAQFHLAVGYEGVSIHAEEYYVLEMLANIWGGSISSRLFQEIREKRGLVYSVGSFCQYYIDSGIFGVCASTSNDKVIELLNTLSTEIKKITHDISQEEVDRCLAQVKASLHMGRETADSWVGILAGNYSYHGRYISREEIWQHYSNITIDQLHNLAKKIFSKAKPITVTTLGETNMLPNYEQMQELLTI